MDKKIIITIFALSLFCIALTSAIETNQVAYTLQLKYSYGDCTQVCNSEIINSTEGNVTNETICNQTCNLIIELRGLPSDKHTIVPGTVDTTSDQFKNKEGQWIDLYGTYIAELGNTTDITGLNEKLDNWTDAYEKLLKCQTTLNIYDFNLSNCMSQTGYSSNYTLETCDSQRMSLQSTIDQKNQEINNANENLEKEKSSKQTWGILGLLIGVALMKFVLPSIQGKNTPKDSSEEQFPGNTGY